MHKLLEVIDLKKYFVTKNGLLHAVDGVSFSVEEGKTLGVVGESGCGKSTLGRLVIRLIDATDGKIIYEGQDITKTECKGSLRREMQIIFQDPFSSLNPRMSVYQIIEEPIRIHKMYKNKAEIPSKVNELMARVGLAAKYADSYPHELDGGRRQRIGIARALALNPKFIVCDEPVSALDVSIQAQILNLLMDLQEDRKLTYMFISHDLSVVKHVSDEIMVMYLGLVVEKCKTDELFEHTLHPYSKALLSAVPEPKVKKKKEMKLIQGEITSPIDPKPGCRFAPRCTYARQTCHQVTPELKEIMPGHFVSCHFVNEINSI
ncbi:MAG TPA: ATP-binding cassette domain-containing protein [Sedimentibacter sp.]|jgi:peptide/nickel transport system ATP-binding protein|nr:ATP-binding cassette domain-containing protein [Sedimentibacter sp.]HOW22262.1 ATP-binding cassette domain-containing protein [Sedimentibacter sp.]HRC80388.1 ATP-binding cassette domain-containing protein [Sedimentibacter sp.]